VSRRLGPHLTVGSAFRGFSFEKNLAEGYFDPDYYGIVEASVAFTVRPSPWNLLLEVAPGLQQVREGGDRAATVRSTARVGYRVGAGREVFLAAGYSSAGLVRFATTATDYRYTAITLGTSWTF
jgi:hypothetical protein